MVNDWNALRGEVESEASVNTLRKSDESSLENELPTSIKVNQPTIFIMMTED